jgi:hypothetical protein
VAGRERGIFFVIVKGQRTARKKCCRIAAIFTMNRGSRTARR